MGGAVYIGTNALPSLVNCTIARNKVDYWRAAINCEDSTVTIVNCIIWDNQWDALDGDAIVTYSDIAGGSEGEGNIDVDPRFALSSDFHLMPGSPCIDAGSNEPPGSLAANDLDGNPRPLDGNGDALAVADMGAYELDTGLACVSVSPPELHFCTYEGGPVPTAQILSIRSSSVPSLSWEVAGKAEWLTVEPISGESSGDIDEVIVSVETSGLVAGVYACDLVVLDAQAMAIPRTVHVTLNLGHAFRVPSEYPTIQAAIDAAESTCDTVLIADGVYTGEGNKNLDFGGKPIVVRSENGPEDCVIDCEGSGRGFRFHSGESRVAAVDGLTITGGNAELGGAILCQDGRPTIANCEFTDNAADYGGAVYCARDAALTACAFVGNVATSDGGGIRLADDGAITGCLFVANVAISGGGIRCDGYGRIEDCTIEANLAYSAGGGIVTHYGAAIADCTIRANEAYENGGGVYCLSDMTVTACLITENDAGRNGGGICCDGEAEIIGCTIARNDALQNGGGIACVYSYGSVTVTDCTIAENSARQQGGGVYSIYSDFAMTNCVIRENAGLAGGGLCVHDDQCTLMHCTVIGNAAELAGAAYVRHDGSLLITNSILRENTPGEVDVDDSDTLIVMSHCNVSGGWPGEGNIDLDPLFAFDDDLHLMPGSPCIDAGTDDPPGGLPPTDREGNARMIDGDGDSVAQPDMGAYEFDPNRPAIAFSPAAIEFNMFENGDDPEAQLLRVRNCGQGMLAWEVADECSWLDATPASGQSDGEIDEITFSVQGAGLTHGVHDHKLRIFDPQAANSPRVIPVSVRVNRVHSVPAEHATIQDAIDATTLTGDVVLVADGTYTGAGNRDLDFGGKNIVVRSQNGPEHCTIDCEGSDTDPHRGFLFQSGEALGAVVEGFTITDGYARPSPASAGGGIHCVGSSPTIRNCAIMNCWGEDFGGGVSVYAGGSPSIIDCLIMGNAAFYGGGGVRCTFDSRATIRDCTIVENVVNGDLRGGGGIYCYDSNITVTDCLIAANTSLGGGGGIACWCDSRPTFRNCAIADNWAELYGGGVLCQRECTDIPFITFIDCGFYRNTTPGRGGALISYHCDVRLAGCSITDNEAGEAGGGIHCRLFSNIEVADCDFARNIAGTNGGGVSAVGDSYLTIVDSLIEENEANHGGGVHCIKHGASLIDCVVRANLAHEQGGGLYSETEQPQIARCVFADNIATGSGGATYCASGRHSISQSLLTGNQAQHGGAVACGMAQVDLANCTIVANRASSAAGAVACESGGRVTIGNCILRLNAPDEIAGDQAELSVEYSDVAGGWPGIGNIDADPLFVDPDGPDDDPNTWEDNDYRLMSRSPCVDAGSNWLVLADFADLDGDGDVDEYTPLDLDGEGRFFDDPNTPDAGCGVPPIVDMGAYERGGTGPQPCFGDLDGNRVVDMQDLFVLLAQYGTTGGATGADGDMDCNGDVSLRDLAELLGAYGTMCD